MKAIKRKNAYGMGGTFDQPGYEYDPVNDTFKDLESGKVFSKEYVAPTGGTGTGTSTVKLETNKEVSITANGEIEITPTSGKDAMEKVTANVAVPVPVLEDNKAASIDVSQYTEPVEITPTSGKDGMKKNTITLSNIPSGGGGATAYCWKYTYDNTDFYDWFNFSVAPTEQTDNDKVLSITAVNIGGDICPTRVEVMTIGNLFGPVTYVKISDTSFSIQQVESDPPTVYTRYSDRDFTLW